MRNMYCSLLLLIVFLCIPSNISACSASEKSNYSKMASNIGYKYDYVIYEDRATFNVTFYNIPENFTILGDGNHSYSGSELTIYNLSSGMHRFEIKTDLNGCGNINLYTKYIELPYYNYLSSTAICNGIEKYELCNKFTTTQLNIDYDTFKEKVISYKKSLKVDDTVNSKETFKGFYDRVYDFYSKYYLIILPLIIITGTGFIINERKQNSFFRKV